MIVDAAPIAIASESETRSRRPPSPMNAAVLLLNDMKTIHADSVVLSLVSPLLSACILNKQRRRSAVNRRILEPQRSRERRGNAEMVVGPQIIIVSAERRLSA